MPPFRTLITRFLLGGALYLLIGTSLRVQAQSPGSGGPTPGNPPPAPPTAVPIDGGASLLLAGGAVYALNRLRQRQAR
jgi:hypothetical protein